MGLSKRIVYLKDFAEEASKLRGSWGKTDLYQTGYPGFDEYLGGGYGRADGYEILLMYGDTGVGKSMVALNMLKQPILDGKRVGLLVLEDDGADVFLRMNAIIGQQGFRDHVINGDSVHFMSQEDLVKSWTLGDLMELIENWFVERKLDVILLDHLQFAFEGAESIHGENEYISQRIFMQNLNQLMKRVKKTIILISHVNKANGSKGMNKIVGSGSLAQAGTKVLEISDSKLENGICVFMRKSRFTQRRTYHYDMKLINGVLETAL